MSGTSPPQGVDVSGALAGHDTECAGGGVKKADRTTCGPQQLPSLGSRTAGATERTLCVEEMCGGGGSSNVGLESESMVGGRRRPSSAVLLPCDPCADDL